MNTALALISIASIALVAAIASTQTSTTNPEAQQNAHAALSTAQVALSTALAAWSTSPTDTDTPTPTAVTRINLWPTPRPTATDTPTPSTPTPRPTATVNAEHLWAREHEAAKGYYTVSATTEAIATLTTCRRGLWNYNKYGNKTECQYLTDKHGYADYHLGRMWWEAWITIRSKAQEAAPKTNTEIDNREATARAYGYGKDIADPQATAQAATTTARTKLATVQGHAWPH